jgi:hypothetical protein
LLHFQHLQQLIILLLLVAVAVAVARLRLTAVAVAVLVALELALRSPCLLLLLSQLVQVVQVETLLRQAMVERVIILYFLAFLQQAVDSVLMKLVQLPVVQVDLVVEQQQVAQQVAQETKAVILQ